MEKMIIVDDNKREREGVSTIINWRDYGIEIVKLCANGKEALEFMDQNPVDIVLSDVEMPIMNGINLLKKMREKTINSKFIFMSCYDEFDFVKSAMDLGANGYILKPVETGELENMIEKVLKLHKTDRQREEHERMCMEIIERNPTVVFEYFLRQLLYNMRKDEQSIRKEAQLLKIPQFLTHSRVVMIKLCADDNEISDTMMFISSISEKIGTMSTAEIYIKLVTISQNKVAVVLLYSDGCSEKAFDLCMELKEYSHNTLGYETAFGISKESKRGLYDLHILYGQAEEAVDTFFASDNERVILYDEVEEHTSDDFGFIDVSQLQKDVNAVIAKGDIQVAREMIARYLNGSDIIRNKNYIRYFSYVLLSIIETSLINANINTDSIVEYSKIWSKLAKIETIFDIKQWFENIFRTVFETIEMSRQSKGKDIVEAVKKIIQSEYGSHITVNYISNKIHFSGVHINNVFKRETGMAIFDYLINYRMEMAKKLLQQPGSKVYAAAKLVGYTNQTHFKILFLQHVGMTPVEYKKVYEKKDNI